MKPASLRLPDEISQRLNRLAERAAQFTQKYSHAAGPQISNTPRSPQRSRGHDPDRGPSR